MNRDQVAALFAKASAAYPNKAPDLRDKPQIFEIWVERLAPIDPERALRNLNMHIDSSKFFPDIADIIRQDLMTDYEVLRLETAERFSEMEQWKREAVSLPEHLAHKSLRSGSDDPDDESAV